MQLLIFTKLMSQKFLKCILNIKKNLNFKQAVSEKIKKKSANQKQELPVATMFVNGSGQNEQTL